MNNKNNSTRISGNEFFAMCKEKLITYYEETLNADSNKKLYNDDIFIVWYSKTLQNHKALMADIHPDGMYYEFTYDGDKEQLYMDVYKKWQNICYKK